MTRPTTNKKKPRPTRKPQPNSATVKRRIAELIETGCPETARGALEKWKRDEMVPTIEMGGLGPGYEQAIHIAVFAIIDALLVLDGPLDWDNTAWWSAVEARVLPRLRWLGLSGAQWAVATNLAGRAVRIGWAAVLAEVPRARRIYVTRTFPQEAP